MYDFNKKEINFAFLRAGREQIYAQRTGKIDEKFLLLGRTKSGDIVEILINGKNLIKKREPPTAGADLTGSYAFLNL